MFWDRWVGTTKLVCYEEVCYIDVSLYKFLEAILTVTVLICIFSGDSHQTSDDRV
jgi:hypothetical protein